MGRPRKSVDAVRLPVAFRLTEAEIARMDRLAQGAGLGRSEYARGRLLAAPVVPLRPGTEPALDAVALTTLADQMRRAGVNVNQWVRRMHETGREPPAEALAALAEIRAVIRKAAELLP